MQLVFCSKHGLLAVGAASSGSSRFRVRGSGVEVVVVVVSVEAVVVVDIARVEDGVVVGVSSGGSGARGLHTNA